MADVNLNELPLELKPLTPFLQRAQELKVKDPTMSYWCCYYAVQQGVHIKPREKDSRAFLMKLMAPLEKIRADDSSSVVTSNDAACLYIEDFALRVFDAADNEDRKGEASRGTAKKFLAAANFLELLKVFEENQGQPSSSNNDSSSTTSVFASHKDKIKYAKWKAADIAKAFREGRRPVPGPANGPDRRSGAVAVEPMFGPGPGPTYEVAPLPSQFSRASSSTNSPHATSPVPGGSRNPSVSPGRREIPLPLTGINGNAGKGILSPPNSAGIRPRTTSQSFSGLPVPPKDLLGLATPAKPMDSPQSSAFATPGKPGVSPGGWSTSATPGGFEDSVKRSGLSNNQGYGPGKDVSSPSKVPRGTKLPEDEPRRVYPSTPALPLAALRNVDDDTDEETDTKAITPNRQTSYGSTSTVTATTAGGFSRQNSYKDSKTPTPGEEKDVLGSLPNSSSNGSKKVRWTPSVVGGSTVASSSPPSSPRSPLGELPTLPESSDSSSNGDIRFSGTNKDGSLITPPSSVDDHSSKSIPKNPYAETHLKPVPTPLIKLSPSVVPGLIPTSQGSSAQSTPTLPTQPLRRSPLPPSMDPNQNQNSATPKSAAFIPPPLVNHQQPLNFPAASAPTSPSAVSNGPPTVVPTRHRRASSSSAPDAALQPMSALIKPGPGAVVPFVPPRVDPNAPKPTNALTLGRPRALGGYSPPNKTVTPPLQTPKELPKALPFRLINAAKKHSKFAVSALEFDDLEYARRELMAALAILNGERTE